MTCLDPRPVEESRQRNHSRVRLGTPADLIARSFGFGQESSSAGLKAALKYGRRPAGVPGFFWTLTVLRLQQQACNSEAEPIRLSSSPESRSGTYLT